MRKVTDDSRPTFSVKEWQRVTNGEVKGGECQGEEGKGCQRERKKKKGGERVQEG